MRALSASMIASDRPSPSSRGSDRYSPPGRETAVGRRDRGGRATAHGVDLGDRDRESPIFRLGVGAMALKQAAIEEDGLAGRADDVARPGHFAGGAGELDLHYGVAGESRERYDSAVGNLGKAPKDAH